MPLWVDTQQFDRILSYFPVSSCVNYTSTTSSDCPTCPVWAMCISLFMLNDYMCATLTVSVDIGYYLLILATSVLREQPFCQMENIQTCSYNEAKWLFSLRCSHLESMQITFKIIR